VWPFFGGMLQTVLHLKLWLISYLSLSLCQLSWKHSCCPFCLTVYPIDQKWKFYPVNLMLLLIEMHSNSVRICVLFWYRCFYMHWLSQSSTSVYILSWSCTTGIQEGSHNKDGRARHSAWRNYDDLNEFFWWIQLNY
jgi:hypothetical protein